MGKDEETEFKKSELLAEFFNAMEKIGFKNVDCYYKYGIFTMFDEFVKSPNNLSFRAKREIFPVQYTEKIRFLPAVEMTHSLNLTFYEFINVWRKKSK